MYMYYHMSHAIRKPDFCICEHKGTDQLCSNCTADQHLGIRYTDSTFPALLIPKISKHTKTTYNIASQRDHYIIFRGCWMRAISATRREVINTSLCMVSISTALCQGKKEKQVRKLFVMMNNCFNVLF